MASTHPLEFTDTSKTIPCRYPLAHPCSGPLDTWCLLQMECAVCMEAFDLLQRLPKFLPCGHSCCLACLQQMAQPRCPTCTRVSRESADADGVPCELEHCSWLQLTSPLPAGLHSGRRGPARQLPGLQVAGGGRQQVSVDVIVCTRSCDSQLQFGHFNCNVVASEPFEY